MLLRRLWLSLAAGTIGFSSTVNAAEEVVLRYNTAQVQTSTATLRTLAHEHRIPEELNSFFRETKLPLVEAQRLLTTRIAVSPQVIEENLDSVTAEFVLIQLDKVLGRFPRQGNLEPLRQALSQLEQQESLSLLELIEQYPEAAVSVDLQAMSQIYQDVNLFISRIQPLLRVVDELLPELVCDCNLEPQPLESDAFQTWHSPLVPVQDQQKGRSPTVCTRLTQERPAASLAKATSAASDDKQLVFVFGPLRPAFSLQDLQRFTETGELSRGIRFYLAIAGVSPEDLRQALTQEVEVSVEFLDRWLNSFLGEYALVQVGQVVHTRSRRANIQALRSALVQSAQPDGRVSLLEFLQYYPLPQIYVNGVRLARYARTAGEIVENPQGTAIGVVRNLEGWLADLQASAAKDICDCQSEHPD